MSCDVPAPHAGDHDRDLRADFVRGIALLIIFSNHVIGNPVRAFMPISLGFSDMAEVFVFASGYLNGLRRPTAGSSNRTMARCRSALTRCLKLYGAILLMHVLTCGVLYIADFCGTQRVSIAVLLLPQTATKPDLWQILTLQSMLINSCVLAIYLLLVGIVPFVAVCIRRSPVFVVLASCGLYLSVQIWPEALSLPSPWKEAFFFNPLAWQLPFILGMAYGATGAESIWRSLIPRNWLALFAAMCVLEFAFLIQVGWWDFPSAVGSDSVAKPNLGPLRLVHFYGVLILGRTLLVRDAHFLKSAILQPVVLCGRHSLATYCTGGLLATIGTLLVAKYGTSFPVTFAINVVGWTGCLLIACVAAELNACFRRPF